MTLLTRLRSALSRFKGGGAEPPESAEGQALLVFAGTGEVIRAEGLLLRAGMPVKVMAPPPALRTGCDMLLVVPLIHAFQAVTILEKNSLPPLQVAPAGEGLLEPVSLFQSKDYGQWLMVRAANMKVTIEKATGRIVNVSGGGCPDVPYLAACLTGRNIREKNLVREHGQTLCGYALYLAAGELQRLHDEKETGR